jgi:Holliday junction resolvase RusA-like endonuclease
VQADRYKKIMPSEAYLNYEEYAMYYLPKLHEPLTGQLWLQARYWLPDHRWWPDLVGLLQSTCDLLQHAGVIENDKDICCLDGSEIAGIDRENPRAEIDIGIID